MNADNITRFQPDPSNPPTMSAEELAQLDAMTDAEVEEVAWADPDANPLSRDALDEFERVPDVKAIRKQLNLSQREFAQQFHLSLSAIRDWEQGRFQPDQAARTLLKVIARIPDEIRKALAEHPHV
jgi:putative transcriptional regulator